jgi:hypothetical protein
MGRHLSRAPESRDAARVYVVESWTEPVTRLVDAALRVQAFDLMMGSRANAINERQDSIRALNELVTARSGLPVAMRQASQLVNEIAELTARRPPEFWATDHGCELDVAGLRDDAATLLSAFMRLRDRLAPVANQAATWGTGDKLRSVAAALHTYEKKPTAASRKALNRALHLESVGNRAALVRRAEHAAPAIRTASPTVWAHYAISVGLDEPCNSAVLASKRREAWREVLKNARARAYSGGRRRTK